MRDEAKQEQPCPYNSYSKGAGAGGGGGVGGMYLTEDTRLTLTLTEITNPETIHTRIERNTSVRCEETIFTTSSRLNNSKTRYLIQQMSIFPSELHLNFLTVLFCLSQKRLYVFAVNVIHNLLITLPYLTLLLAVNFLALSQCHKQTDM